MGPIDAESKIWKEKIFFDRSWFLSFDLFRSYIKETYVREQQLSYLIDWRNLKSLMVLCAHYLNLTLNYHRRIYDLIDGPIREFCQKFVYSFVNDECHENDGTIDYGENDRSYKSCLIDLSIIDLKVSTCPRKIIMKKGLVWHVYAYSFYLELNWSRSTLSIKC